MHYSAQNFHITTWQLPRFSLSQLKQECTDIQQKLYELGKEIQEDSQPCATICRKFQDYDVMIREFESYSQCKAADNIGDPNLVSIEPLIKQVRACYNVVLSKWQDKLKLLSEEDVEQQIADPEFQFFIKKNHLLSRHLVSPEQEKMLHELSVDGLHGWQEIYYLVVGGLSIKDPCTNKMISMGQAENRLLSIQDHAKRNAFFRKWETKWKEKELSFASVLNHIAGYRLTVARIKGWSEVIDQALFHNHMQRTTLEAMWQAVGDISLQLLPYLEAKKRKFGINNLSWADVSIDVEQNELLKIDYESALALIEKEVSSAHPEMGRFVRLAATNRWIEVENRKGKRSGAFCAPMPRSRESRIFMTYEGNLSNLLTLAHELGHAYHNFVLQKRSGLEQHVPMCLAESASTYAEQVVLHALYKQSQNDRQKLLILDLKLQRSVLYLMNIYARYLFETGFYEKRKECPLNPHDLCALMQRAQQKAFCGGLSSYHPYFWCSKQHFYFTEDPFYHFPYTFGYILSHYLYRASQKKSAEFSSKYDAYLADSGSMYVEPLIWKHFQIDVSSSQFVKEALHEIQMDVEEFVRLSR